MSSAQRSTDVRVDVLGPLLVGVGPRSVAVSGAKPAAIVAVLAHEAAPVAPARLVELVWDQESDDRLEHRLQQHVSELRKLLEPDRSARGGSAVLPLRRGGYELVAEVDLVRFVRMLDDAESARRDRRDGVAVELLDAALALWRGPAFADTRSGPWFDSAAERIEARRLRALEVRGDALLALGRHGELVADLEQLVEQSPFRERFWCQLMVALYRSGRQADALVAYRRARSAFVTELGLEPGPELRLLERQVLDQDAALDLDGGPDRSGTVSAPVSAPVSADVLGDVRATHRVGSGGAGGSLRLPDGQVVHLGPGRQVVGRQPGCAVLLADSRVSRMHAEIVVGETSGSGVEVRDLGSTNGTFVDGDPVTTATLTGGETVSFGGVELVYSPP